MREVTLYEQFGTRGRLYYNRQRGQVKLTERSDGLKVFRSGEDGITSSEDGNYPDSVPWVPFELGEAVDSPCPTRARWHSRARARAYAKSCCRMCFLPTSPPVKSRTSFAFALSHSALRRCRCRPRRGGRCRRAEESQLGLGGE